MQSTIDPAIKTVLDVALALEIFENELYKAVLGSSASAAQNNAFAAVRAQMQAVPGTLPTFTQMQTHEAAHVTTLQSLGATNIFNLSAASFDFTGNRSASGGGPFARATTDLTSLLDLTQAVESTGMRAYKGQLASLSANSAILESILRIHSVEARHAARIGRMRNVAAAPAALDEPLDRAAVVAIVQPFFIPTIA